MEEKEVKNLITVPEAAKEAGVSPQAIRNAIYEGKLLSQQLYGRQLIDRTDFDNYLTNRRGRGRPVGTGKKSESQIEQ